MGRYLSLWGGIGAPGISGIPGIEPIFPGKLGIVIFPPKYSGKVGNAKSFPGNRECITFSPGWSGIELSNPEKPRGKLRIAFYHGTTFFVCFIFGYKQQTTKSLIFLPSYLRYKLAPSSNHGRRFLMSLCILFSTLAR